MSSHSVSRQGGKEAVIEASAYCKLGFIWEGAHETAGWGWEYWKTIVAAPADADGCHFRLPPVASKFSLGALSKAAVLPLPV